MPRPVPRAALWLVACCATSAAAFTAGTVPADASVVRWRKTVTMQAPATAPPLASVTVPSSPAPQPVVPIVPPARVAAGFALLAGWLDTVTFSRFGMYCNMMTGNTINFAASLGTLQIVSGCFFAAAIFAYMAGIAAFRRADRHFGRRVAPAAVAPAVFLLFAGTDVLLAHSGGSRWALLLVTGACGIVNGASGEATGTITTMLTGHMQKLANHALDAVRGAADPASSGAAKTSMRIVGSFVLGVLLGAGMALDGPARRLLPAALRLPPYVAIGLAQAALLLLLCGKPAGTWWAELRGRYVEE